LISIGLAIVDGTLEEVLWRGTYLVVFRDNPWLALIYPSIGFAIWHFAPQSIIPFEGQGGKFSLVIAVGFLGLLWAWVANSTGVIVWTVIAHILIDFSALGWPPRRVTSTMIGDR
jgi:membrane protease YdiL (CAAX protease family)